MKIAFIGGGAMGEAMVKGLLLKNFVPPDDIIVSDPSPSRCEHLAQTYKVCTTQHNFEAIKDAQVVVMAVKPQNLPEVMTELKGHLQKGQLIISVAARVSLATLCQGFGHQTVVRVMPNIFASIGEAVSIWISTSEVSPEQKGVARSILAALGQQALVNDERYLDMATAVSGSGPAYIFLVIEAFIDAAVHIGFPRDVAQTLVLQTVLGAARYTLESGKHPAELRNLVTSPGGTTTEGLLKLEEGALRALFTKAVIAAYEKAKPSEE